MNQAPDLSVIVPAYNEERRLPPTLLDLVDYFNSQALAYEIIVVDDGSKDSTAAVVEKFSKLNPTVHLLSLAQNMGKGAAVKQGVLSSKGKRVLFADADGATPIAEYEKLAKELDAGCDLAIGSRALYSEDTNVTTKWYRKFLGRSFNWVVNQIILPGIADTQCGFKLFSRPAADFLFSRQTAHGFSFDVELLFLAQRAGLIIAEVPINWTNIPGSKVNLVVDATKMFIDVLKFRIRHRSVSPADFMGVAEQAQ